MPNTIPKNRMRTVLLTIGAMTGLVLAASGLVDSWSLSPDTLPDDVIAKVGDHHIPLERYIQLLNDLSADSKTPINAEDRQFVLDRLIDEELLIMRGIELGLSERAPEIRKAIAAAGFKIIIQPFHFWRKLDPRRKRQHPTRPRCAGSMKPIQSISASRPATACGGGVCPAPIQRRNKKR